MDVAGPERRPRPEARIQLLREEARFLVDEIYDREAQLPHPPEHVCPGCERPVPASK